MSRRLRLCVWLVALLPLSGLAGEDFSKGLEQFEKLGLPDVSKAEYVQLSPDLKHSVSEMFFSRHARPGGNAWLLKETLDKDGKPLKGEFVVNGCQLLELSWDGRRGAVWTRASAERDAKRALAFVEKGREGGVFDDEGRIFLFALQLRQRGLAAESDRLLAALFKATPNRGTVVGAALKLLADCQAGELFQAFQRGQNWGAYRDGLKALLAKYPAGWDSGPSARRLLSLVERKAANPDTLAATTKGLSPSEKDLALGLARAAEIRVALPFETAPRPWLLADAWKGKLPPDDADLKVRALGLAALPFLLKLVDDDTLTGVDHAALASGMFMHRIGRGGADELPSFARPATLGELARRLLLELLPKRGFGSYDGGELEAVDQRAQEFWERHRSDSPERFAMVFLGGGYAGYNPMALKCLVRMARADALPDFEKFLLGGEAQEAEGEASFVAEPEGEIRNAVGAFVQYAAVRGGAQAFTQKFLGRLEAEGRDMKLPANVSYGGAKGNAKRLEEGKKQVRDWAAKIRATSFGAPVGELLADCLAKGSLPGYGFEALRAKLEALGPDEAAGIVLRQAVDAKEPKAREQAAKLLDGLDGVDKPTANAGLWRTLLDDHRPAGDAGFQISDCFLNLNEKLYAPRLPAEEFEPWRPPRLGLAAPLALIGDYGDAGRAFLRERVLARLSGMAEKDLPPWPPSPRGRGPRGWPPPCRSRSWRRCPRLWPATRV